MAKKKLTTEEERAWERGLEERLRSLRELAGGRARREWLVAHGLDPDTPPQAPPASPTAVGGTDLRLIVSRSLTVEERRRLGFPEPN